MTPPGDEFDSLAKMMREALHPDLKPYVRESEFFGEILHHPLVIQTHVIPGMANRTYTQKMKACDEALATGMWGSFVWLHERPYRLNAFYLLKGRITDPTEYWNLLATIWSDSENIQECLDEWETVLFDTPFINERDAMMDSDERKVLADLPEVVTVYRGCRQEENEDGFSWTLDRDRAAWFARRWHGDQTGDPIVLVGEIHKDEIVAYLDHRNEREIIAHFDNVKVTRVIEVPADLTEPQTES